MAWLTGYPRNEIDWNPQIDTDLCVKCGMCMNCGKKVFVWTDEGPVVGQPEACVVGCSTCKNLCRGAAIAFPDVAELRRLYRREGIWDKVRTELVEAGVIPASADEGG